MSRRYWTADWHLGHGNIIKYCERPFNSIEHMTERIVGNANMRVKEDDVLVHVGDFCTRGVCKGVEGLRLYYRDYVKLVNGSIVLLEGNHDPQNKTKTVGRYMFAKIGEYMAFVSHYPTDSDIHPPSLIDAVYNTCHFAICGHVHEKWKTMKHHVTHGQAPLLNINVGVDQHKFNPVSDDEIIAIYRKATHE